MHDAGFVRGHETGNDLAGDVHRARNRQLSFTRDQPGQIAAVDVRHRDVLDAVDLAEIVNANDVLVRDVPGEQQLALEAALEIARGGGVLQRFGTNHLDRDDDGELFVPGLEHRAHAALTQRANEVIPAAEPHPRLQLRRRKTGAGACGRTAPVERGSLCRG